ncbi:DNA polymerase epsilon catalytic subunit [Orbilia oligospora]|uniref:DNA polymerase epsilon catalytic subunit n=2 Tax=Orbilia oligospora TaxID=2813651 RepID=A0A7C8NGR2_ORBOL|nr:DNA polymerase epsilon catalytic subunit [Orbilia oligospora]KAF3114077.1 DNA polymerase epsilon catalytic subunit [Orbilia oligospora]
MSKGQKGYKVPYRGGPRSGGRYLKNNKKAVDKDSLLATDRTSSEEKWEATKLANSIDEKMGFPRYEAGPKKIGWLINMHSTAIEDENNIGGKAGVDFYFIDDEGGSFKATVLYDPYILIACKAGFEMEVEEWMRRKFEGLVKSLSRLTREDLQMPNHLMGYRRIFIKIDFHNVPDLLSVRKVLMPIAEDNKKQVDAIDTYAEVTNSRAGFDLFDDPLDMGRANNAGVDASDYIVDIREYDVPYHVRVSIDLDIRIGKWYTVEAKHGIIGLSLIEDRLARADPVVLAFDIETTKLPLKFPDALIDQIMMISYMIDGQGFLITNREIVSEDIEDFEYTPKPEYEGEFMIFNEPNERGVLERFFDHIKEARPTVIVTYNGDFFDWPFVEARASALGIDMYHEIGFRKDSEGIYKSNYCAHMDAFAWVNRDSYLPQGSRGLKAVTTAKLGYDPDELDPELMTRYASERPQTLAEYSVSDAVATYYLYMKYVHPFIFSLCTIIPLGPDDVLRKGTGTLCEMLLMVQAFQKDIIIPNKHKNPDEVFWEGHLVESETYVGGHVEALEAGVFRSDIPANFSVDPGAIDELLRDLDAALKFAIVVESNKKLEDVTNYDEVKEKIAANLMDLKTTPNRSERPLIYHLDVASMYPNIMTTNRLQPDSMIKESDCAACDFNRPGKTCDRRLPWAWRGEFLPPKRDEYLMIRRALENERFPPKYPNGPCRSWDGLPPSEQAGLIKKRLTEYSKKIYHKIKETRTIEREAIICQRENPFYVDTVRMFRDRRYYFKGEQKVWKNKTDSLKKAGATQAEIDEGGKMVVLFDSLQLAHKVILNSFYGYVMRKGSRWYSLEMAGVTCLTGSRIIQLARQLVERIGRPLELDTDGIWCILPATFPENFVFNLSGGKKLPISYPCVMLNHLVHDKFTNHQYQDLVDKDKFKYETHAENSIFFEVDGPYKAMILPTSKEEDKGLKKRYAVFNHDGSLAELKGFEVKRRGELKLIKIFQTQIFKVFLEGTTLAETYAAVAKVANRWLDVLYQQGSTLADEELIELICENRNMAKTLDEYGTQKSTSIKTARRLAEFLGDQMVKDKGLNCKYIISAKPRGAPVTERAVPVAIFSAEESIKKHFLRKWLREDITNMDPRNVVDWSYYLERLGSVIQKLITIPAALQKVRNPVPRIVHPDWLQRRINAKDDKLKQKKMTDMFKKEPMADVTSNAINLQDMEDFGSTAPVGKGLESVLNKAAASQSLKRKAPEPVVPVDPYASLPAKMPAIDKDYKGFLQYQKKKWKIQRHARERRRQLFGDRQANTGEGLDSMFRQQAQLVYMKAWQVLHFAETDVPGEVNVHVLIDRKIHIVTVVVPRTIFINFRSKDVPNFELDQCSSEPVNFTLPNGHSSSNLFRLTMPEQIYVEKFQKMVALTSHPTVEGIYETDLPLNVRAMLQLGNTCTLDGSTRGVLGKGIKEGFDLKDILQQDAQQPYLGDAQISYLYLFHLVAGDRQFVSLVSSSGAEAQVFVLNAQKDTQSLPNIDKMYAEQILRRNKESHGQGPFEYLDTVHFKTTYINKPRLLYRNIDDAIKKLKSEEQKAFVLVIQSPYKSTLCKEIRSLNEFPMLSLQIDQTDSSLPPLGWQNFVAKRIVIRYLSLGSWLSHLIELARYGNVPLCNLVNHDPRFLVDIAYARRLQASNVVLWWSPTPIPDHAGHQKDSIVRSLEHVNMPDINNRGSYSSVCIELDVRNLAINTLLTSSLINELEGADAMGFNPAGKSNGEEQQSLYTENTFASASITVLRDLVKSWWGDATKGNSMADLMVQHLVRWVESPESFLYDHALHFYVQTMSKKAFLQLLADFRRVGSSVVYASANRLILQTTKAEVGTAYAYSQYILKAIKAKPLFNFLDLDVKEYWDYLLWYDPYNYGGLACSEVVEADKQKLNLIMHWQFSKALPQTMQEAFSTWVVEFVHILHSFKHPENSAGMIESTPRMTQLPPRATDGGKDDIGDVLTLPKEFLKPLKKNISQLLRLQHDIILHPDRQSEFEFPSLPGTKLGSSNAVLELVKAMSAVFALPKDLMLSTRQLRKDLLHMFDIKEFSKEGQFENTTESLRFEQVICQNCTMSRDLDFCRDEDLMPELDVDGKPSKERAWRCFNCGHEYDRLALQERMVGEVEEMLIRYSTQDLVCFRCKKIKTSDFQEHCACSGVWKLTIPKEGIVAQLKIYKSVAEYYSLQMLEENVKVILEGI